MKIETTLRFLSYQVRMQRSNQQQTTCGKRGSPTTATLLGNQLGGLHFPSYPPIPILTFILSSVTYHLLPPPLPLNLRAQLISQIFSYTLPSATHSFHSASNSRVHHQPCQGIRQTFFHSLLYLVSPISNPLFLTLILYQATCQRLLFSLGSLIPRV